MVGILDHSGGNHQELKEYFVYTGQAHSSCFSYLSLPGMVPVLVFLPDFSCILPKLMNSNILALFYAQHLLIIFILLLVVL